MMKATLVIALLASACGASPQGWMREAHQLANAPLQCGDIEIATQHVVGFVYDSIGCEHAVRQICQNQVCAPSGDTGASTDPAYEPFRQRVEEVREALAVRAASVVETCGDGRPVGALLEIDGSGRVTNAFVAESSLRRCLMRNIGRMPAGPSTMMLTYVFRAN